MRMATTPPMENSIATTGTAPMNKTGVISHTAERQKCVGLFIMMRFAKPPSRRSFACGSSLRNVMIFVRFRFVSMRVNLL